MIQKLVIIIVLIAGGVLLYTQLDKLNLNSTINVMTEDLDGLKNTTIKRLDYEINKTKDTVNDKINDITPNLNEINPISKLEEAIAIPKIESEK